MAEQLWQLCSRCSWQVSKCCNLVKVDRSAHTAGSKSRLFVKVHEIVRNYQNPGQRERGACAQQIGDNRVNINAIPHSIRICKPQPPETRTQPVSGSSGYLALVETD